MNYLRLVNSCSACQILDENLGIINTDNVFNCDYGCINFDMDKLHTDTFKLGNIAISGDIGYLQSFRCYKLYVVIRDLYKISSKDLSFLMCDFAVSENNKLFFKKINSVFEFGVDFYHCFVCSLSPIIEYENIFIHDFRILVFDRNKNFVAITNIIGLLTNSDIKFDYCSDVKLLTLTKFKSIAYIASLITN